MNRATLWIVITLFSYGLTAQQAPQATQRNTHGPPSVVRAACNAASEKLIETNKTEVELIVTVDPGGKVHSFQTKQPKDIHLEKIREVAREVKAMHLKPATHENRPVWMQVQVTFDC